MQICLLDLPAQGVIKDSVAMGTGGQGVLRGEMNIHISPSRSEDATSGFKPVLSSKLAS